MRIRERLLGTSAGYQAWKKIVGADRANKMVVQQYIKPQTGESILDVGCGTGDMAQLLEGSNYVGLDTNKSYIETAIARSGGRGKFIHAKAGDLPALGLSEFDKVILVGILHHLDDAEASILMAALPTAMKPGAKLIAIENAWDPHQATTARVLLALDRGRYVRSVDEYERLVNPYFDKIHSELRHDFLRVPYTNVIMTAQNPKT